MRVSVAVLAVSCAACSAPGDSPFFERVSPVVVIDTTPPASSTGVSNVADLQIEFSGDVVAGQALEDAFTLEEAGGPAVPGVSVNYEDRVATISLPNGVELELGTTYRAELTGLVDARGRPLADFAWEFTTIDPPAPALVALLPSPGSTSPGNFVVRAVFNVPLNAAELGATPLRLNAGAVGGVTTYDASSNTLTFHPNATADGAINVTFDLAGVVDIYGRTFVPTGWTFLADDAIVDAVRPTLGAVTATETTSATITVTFDPATDDQWSGSAIRYEALLTKLKPNAPAGCLDPFEPETRRQAVYGSTSGGITFSGLAGGAWSVLLDAEDGSGRRSLANAGGGTVTFTQGVITFATVIEPLLAERCAFSGCHVGNDAPGFVDYTGTRDEIVAHEGQTGLRLVTPFCLEQSYLWHKLVPGYDIEGPLMPPESVEASALSRRERELFRRWIVEQGGN